MKTSWYGTKCPNDYRNYILVFLFQRCSNSILKSWYFVDHIHHCILAPMIGCLSSLWKIEMADNGFSFNTTFIKSKLQLPIIIYSFYHFISCNFLHWAPNWKYLQCQSLALCQSLGKPNVPHQGSTNFLLSTPSPKDWTFQFWESSCFAFLHAEVKFYARSGTS